MSAWTLLVLASALAVPSSSQPQNAAPEDSAARPPGKAVYPGQTLAMPVQYSMAAPASQLQLQVVSSSTPAPKPTAVTTATPSAAAQDRIAKPVVVKVLRSRPQTHTPPPFKSRPSFASKQVTPLTPRFSIPLHLYPGFVKAWEQSQENVLSSQFPSALSSQVAAESNPAISIQLSPQLSHQLNNQLGPKSNGQFESQIGQFGSNNIGQHGPQINHFNQHINSQGNQIRGPQSAGIHVGLNVGPGVGPNLGPTGNHLGPFEYNSGHNAGRNIGPNTIGFSAGPNIGPPGGPNGGPPGGSYGGPPGIQYASPLSGLHGSPQGGPNGGPHAGFQQGPPGGPPGRPGILYGGPPGSVYTGSPGGSYGGPPSGLHGSPVGPPSFHAGPPGGSVGGPPRGLQGASAGNSHVGSHISAQASGHGGPYRTPHASSSDSYAPTYQHYSTAHQPHTQPPISHSATSYRPHSYYGSHSHSHPHYHVPHSHSGHYHSGHHHKGHHHHHSPPNELMELMSPFKKEDGIFPPSTNNPSGLYGSFLMPLMLLGISLPAIGFMYTYFSRRSLNTGFVPNIHVPSQEDLDYYAKLLQEGISCYNNPKKCT
ncbi:hypothetical protein R5R35_002071 [Gryllus longicercus]|uniref:Cuticular protein n=1 Tax=Gryllus longicercus TaxID=2509291 RepID=A0AAN9VF52_9ORTH